MSTSLLYHAWRLRGYRCQRTEFNGGGIDFVIEQNPDTLCCSHCGGQGHTLAAPEKSREPRRTAE